MGRVKRNRGGWQGCEAAKQEQRLGSVRSGRRRVINPLSSTTTTALSPRHGSKGRVFHAGGVLLSLILPILASWVLTTRQRSRKP